MYYSIAKLADTHSEYELSVWTIVWCSQSAFTCLRTEFNKIDELFYIYGFNNKRRFFGFIVFTNEHINIGLIQFRYL